MSILNRSAVLSMSIFAALTIGATALAQVTSFSTNDPYALSPVDQGVSDLGELNTSNRLIPIDLRQPNDFGRLYEAPDSSGRLMRISGGLSAVFPRSEYAASAGFIFPVVPAGTEFFIGPMPVTAPTAEPEPEFIPTASGLLVDSRLNLGTSSISTNLLQSEEPARFRQIHASNNHGVTLDELLAGLTDAPKPKAAPTVWTNERYRQDRIAALLERASR